MSPLQAVLEMTEQLRHLSEVVHHLSSGLDGQLLKLRRTQAVLAVTLALTLALAVSNRMQVVETARVAELAGENQRHIAQNQQRLDVVQHAINADVLCPLYGLFLDSYRPESPQAKENIARYESAFGVIEQGAVALGCQHVTRGRAP